jgi:hypothetical protein
LPNLRPDLAAAFGHPARAGDRRIDHIVHADCGKTVFSRTLDRLGLFLASSVIAGLSLYERKCAIATFAQSPNGGMIQAASGIGAANVNLIITAAARYKLPAVYVQRPFVAAGGLIPYGPNFADEYRRAAGPTPCRPGAAPRQRYEHKVKSRNNKAT